MELKERIKNLESQRMQTEILLYKIQGAIEALMELDKEGHEKKDVKKK
jgi:hypothetical protein